MHELGAKTQLDLIPFVQTEHCQRCASCAARKICRTKALLRLDAQEFPCVDAGRCYGCGDCIRACPFGALTLPKRAKGA